MCGRKYVISECRNVTFLFSTARVNIHGQARALDVLHFTKPVTKPPDLLKCQSSLHGSYPLADGHLFYHSIRVFVFAKFLHFNDDFSNY